MTPTNPCQTNASGFLAAAPDGGGETASCGSFVHRPSASPAIPVIWPLRECKWLGAGRVERSRGHRMAPSRTVPLSEIIYLDLPRIPAALETRLQSGELIQPPVHLPAPAEREPEYRQSTRSRMPMRLGHGINRGARSRYRRQDNPSRNRPLCGIGSMPWARSGGSKRRSSGKSLRSPCCGKAADYSMWQDGSTPRRRATRIQECATGHAARDCTLARN